MFEHIPSISTNFSDLGISHTLEVITFWAFMIILSSFKVFILQDKTVASEFYNSKLIIPLNLSFSSLVFLGFAKSLAIILLYYRSIHLFHIHSYFKLSINKFVLPIVVALLLVTIMLTAAALSNKANLWDMALPFFILLTDMQQIVHILHFSLLNKSISAGIYHCAPEILLDVLAKVLAVGVATSCGEVHIEAVSRVVCLQLCIYPLVVLTFYPAVLFLLLESDLKMSSTCQGNKPILNKEIHMNKAQRNVKLIMSGGLALIHVRNVLTGSFLHPIKDEHANTSAQYFPHLTDTITRLDNVLLCFCLVVFVFVSKTIMPKSKLKQSNQINSTENKSEIKRANVQKSYCIPTKSITPITKRIRTLSADDSKPFAHSHYKTSSIRSSCERSHPKLLKFVSHEDVEITDETKLMEYINEGIGGCLSDEQILQLLKSEKIKSRQLEDIVQNTTRAVHLRRLDLCSRLNMPHAMDRVPYQHYDYKPVLGQCCEEVIGYVPLPVGKVGPILMDGHHHFMPLATTEGCLVASTNRGCKAIEKSGGISSVVYGNKMTRAPVFHFASLKEMIACKNWLESDSGFELIKSAFESTSAHSELLSVLPIPAGHYLHIRFSASTGEAMGMNMVSKGTEKAVEVIHSHFSSAEIVSLSGNMCTDKKSSAVNWLLGRGKSVVVEATITKQNLASLLHVTAEQMFRLCESKNFTGSVMAGAYTGCNAHAANIIAACFAATGQDLAQVVESSSCLTLMHAQSDGSLLVSCTLPCIEVGTIGGGTRLPAQRALLEMTNLPVTYSSSEHLAKLIAATVLCGEVSLTAALASNQLVQAHMRLNRAVGTHGGQANLSVNQHCPM